MLRTDESLLARVIQKFQQRRVKSRDVQQTKRLRVPAELAPREHLEKLPDLRIVKTMHERKALMAELADGFIALPGGYGTFEEFFEVLAWSQLGWHAKPFGLLDIAGFYTPLLKFLDHTREEGFIRPQHRALVLVADSAEKILMQMKNFRPPSEVKWVK